MHFAISPAEMGHDYKGNVYNRLQHLLFSTVLLEVLDARRFLNTVEDYGSDHSILRVEICDYGTKIVWV